MRPSSASASAERRPKTHFTPSLSEPSSTLRLAAGGPAQIPECGTHSTVVGRARQCICAVAATVPLVRSPWWHPCATPTVALQHYAAAPNRCNNDAGKGGKQIVERLSMICIAASRGAVVVLR